VRRRGSPAASNGLPGRQKGRVVSQAVERESMKERGKERAKPQRVAPERHAAVRNCSHAQPRGRNPPMSQESQSTTLAENRFTIMPRDEIREGSGRHVADVARVHQHGGRRTKEGPGLRRATHCAETVPATNSRQEIPAARPTDGMPGNARNAQKRTKQRAPASRGRIALRAAGDAAI